MRSSFIVKLFVISTLLSFKSLLIGQNYEIKVQIKGAENQKAKLAYYQGENKYVEQTANFDKKGKLVFKGNKNLPTGIYLVILNNGYFDFLIDKEQSFSLTSDTADFIKKMKVSGSKENKLFFNYQISVIELNSKFREISEKIKQLNEQSDSLHKLKAQKQEIENSLNDLWKKVAKEQPNSYLAKILTAFNDRNLDKFKFSDPEMLRTPVYHTMLRLFIKKNINKPPSYIIFETRKLLQSLKNVEDNYEYAANYLLNFYNTFYKIGMNEVFIFIADTYFLPDKANWFNEKQLQEINKRRNLLAQSLPGHIAPELTLESNNGEFFSLYQLESKFVMLYFWSSDCGHCTTATKALKNAYLKLQEKNIEIFAVNIDKNTTKWQQKIENLELQWINCQDINEVSGFREKYYVYGSPLLYLISDKKVILSKLNGEEEIEKLIVKLLGE